MEIQGLARDELNRRISEDDKEFDDSDVDCFYNDEEGGA